MGEKYLQKERRAGDESRLHAQAPTAYGRPHMTPCNGETLFFPVHARTGLKMEHPSIVKPLKIKEGTDVVTKERACRHKRKDQSHDP